jgi:8-oxo-dGTP diphosphatase
MKKPKSPILTVDGIVQKNGKVLLERRSVKPFLGYWALPGGHVDYGEKVESAIKREIKEELGISVRIKKLIGVYSDPERHPWYHTVAVVFLCQKIKGKLSLSNEVSEFEYFPLNNLPFKIAFDHRKILNDFKRISRKQ